MANQHGCQIAIQSLPREAMTVVAPRSADIIFHRIQLVLMNGRANHPDLGYPTRRGDSPGSADISLLFLFRHPTPVIRRPHPADVPSRKRLVTGSYSTGNMT